MATLTGFSIRKVRLLLATLAILLCQNMYAQVGEVIWQEDFTNLDNWTTEIGNGNWGWGNGELQFYQAANVDIAPVPGESGNTALRITARQESGPGITDQWGNPLQYTSGRVNTRAKVAIHYGLIEARVRVPDLALGGWPAVWLLGTATAGWPSNGEIDMMEMGQDKAFRDLHDTHNGGNDTDNSTVNQMVGANAIFYAEEAQVAGNPTGAASLAWDPNADFVRPYYNLSNPLNDRFLLYRTYWDKDSLRFTVVDEGVEYDLYTRAFSLDSVSDEFQHPFYLIANMAVGGTFTDVYNLGDPASGSPVSMSFPAEMYIDYIKVSKWNGQGSVRLGPPLAKESDFGLFTDETPVVDQLTIGVDADIYAWENTLAGGVIPPFEGENAISWTPTGAGWFGGGIASRQPLNLSNFSEGQLSFRIKIPGNITFKIGIMDVWGNQHYVTFPANQTTYGLARDGEWGQALIPVSDLRGAQIDLRMLFYPFIILEESGGQGTFALDDMYYTNGLAAHIVTEESRLSQVHVVPNPFSKETEFQYTLTAAESVSLTLYDLQGRKVADLNQGTQAAGVHRISWDAAGLPSGLYLYRLQAGNKPQTGTCLLRP